MSDEEKGDKKDKLNSKDLGNLDVNQLLPFMMGLASSLIEKQPQVNVNVYNDGESGTPNINKYNIYQVLIINKEHYFF